MFPIELSLAVAAALDRLSPDQREAVVLKIYQGFKFDEMAEMLGCPVSTVKSRLYTALELLKTELAPVKAKRCVMSCSPFDLKDYFLKELADPQRRQVEAHVEDLRAVPGRAGPAAAHRIRAVFPPRRGDSAAHRFRLR